MKRNLTFLLTALLLLTGLNVWAQSRTEITDVLNRDLTGVTGTSYTSWEGKTSNSDAVYAGQSAGGNESIQLRSNNSNSGIITTASGGTFTNISVIWNENTINGRTLQVYGSHTAFTSPTELYSAETFGELLGTIVKGDSDELAITGSYEYFGLRSASGAMYLSEIDITWNTDGGTPQETVATPTFNPEAGTYSEAVSVTISCATEGATIYYTLDGTNPMEDGTVYTSAINITETTTVKAFAMKEGYLNSGVASATYTISAAPSPTLITIAEARALATNEYALVQGVVTFIDGRNVYIQDETAGIDLFLNNNTVPSTLALGDMVQAYGKRAAYNGLAELSGINGNDAEQFSILSSGNTLPLTVKTIAEILEGGADALQCTRVKVEGATIGAINTSGNTPLTQDGASINIYKVPALTGIEEGDLVDVISVIGYFNVPQLRVALASDVVLSTTPPIPDPQLSVSTTELNDFTYVLGSGPSIPNNFSVSGSNLVGNVTLTAPQDFEISLNSENGYAGSMVLTSNDGTLAATTIYVRLKAGLSVGTYMGNLTIVSGELSHNIALSGTVDEMPISTITIADARALENGQYAQVEGTVIFIDGRNIYIQDETAGIDLYLNNNTVPSTLAIGDNVRAYGKHAVYNGLVELSGINGGNAEEFSILSSGNTLPLAVKTIAEILEGGADALQCTRVKVEGATIGAINTSGNTPLTQDGASINIYKVPALTGIEEGNLVDVVSVIGYFNVPQLRVALASDVTLIETPSTSTLTVTPTTLSGFEYDFEAGGPSEIQYFTVSGDQLTNDVSVIPSEHFEVSTQIIEQFEPENPAMIYIPESGSFYDIQICVRLKAGLEAGTYNEQIAITSEETETVYVSVSGVVTGGVPTPPPTPTEGEYVRISDLSQLIAGSYVVFAARFDENATDYYAMSNTSSGKPTGVMFTSANSDGNEILPASITDEENNFYWTVGVIDNGYTFTNAAGELIGYENGTNFSNSGNNTEWAIELGTADAGAMVPNYSGFLVTNVNNDQRHYALNSNHNFGPYHSNNFTSNGYNFYLDLFVKAGGEPPVPPTPTVATPTFSPSAGTYTQAQNVSITCTTEGATIYYSTVSENGPWTPYSGAIQVEGSMTIWAYAEKDGYNNSPVASAIYTIQSGGGSMVTIFNQDWEGEMNGWTFVDLEGEMTWTVASYQGNHYAYANGYNHGANTDWCISPAFDLDNYSNEVLTFRTAKNYTGPDIHVYFSNQYDGQNLNPDEWQELVCELSQGGWNWVESGEISLNTLSGTNCHIAFKYTSEENSAAGWEVDDIMLVGESTTTEPVVNVTPLALSGFTYMEGEGPSGEQSFVISGTNLTEPIIVSNPDLYFQISRTSGNDFSNEQSITLDPTNGIIDQTIYVRMAAGLAVSTYSTTLIVNSEVGNNNVTCNGTVTAQPVPGGDYIRINGVSELTEGNRVILSARYNETANAYLAIGNALVNGKLPTTEFTSAMNGGDEIIPSEILSDENNYYWTVGITADGYTFTNAGGQMIGYGNSGTNFVMDSEKTVWTIETGTSDPASMVPDYYGFNIINATTTGRGMALRVTEANSVVGAYAVSNMSNSEYNFFLDIFMQGEGGPCTVAAPTFNPAGGTYYEAQNVSINCSTPGAIIYYSTISENGSWVPYSGPITVDENMTIWAYAELEGCNDSPVVSAEYVIQAGLTIIFNQDWEEDWNGWTERCVYGDSLWHIASYQGNHYAYANGYNRPATEDWLISPAFDLDSYDNVVLSFRTAMNYTGPALEVFFSNDYDGQDPTAATWQELECELSQGGWNWVEASVNLDGFSGTNCNIGFKYTCTDEEAAGWEVDDIMLYSGGVSTDPYLNVTPNSLSGFSHIVGQGPSEVQTFVLTGGNFLELPGGGYGGVWLSLGDLIYSGFEISLDGEEFTTSPLTIDLDETLTLEPTTVYVRLWGEEVGQYTGTIYIEEPSGVSVSVLLTGTVLSENEPSMSILMPLYIQGNNGSNNNRVPMAAPAYFLNLEPNTTYRYTNQFVVSDDGPETAGAGNVIYADPEGFYRSTSPSLATEGGYGEFTTDEYGRAMLVWLMNEPTANVRFTPGNQVYMRVRLNDGHNGTTVDKVFTSDYYATVLNFGNEYGEYQGTAFYVKSNEAPKSFALMFGSSKDGRPIYSTSIETIGVDFGDINQYADFYKEEVAGNDGWFGGILPNDNETGINFIQTVDLYDQNGNQYFAQDGQWYPSANTINPSAGLDEPIFIDLTDDGVADNYETNVKIWSADHEFVIENGDNAHYNMTVYNILGQPMMMKQINAGSAERISHSLATGVYIISLQNNQNAVSVKVIVK